MAEIKIKMGGGGETWLVWHRRSVPDVPCMSAMVGTVCNVKPETVVSRRTRWAYGTRGQTKIKVNMLPRALQFLTSAS